MKSVPPRLRLAEYYLLVGINAVATPLFYCCLMFWTRQTYGYTDLENLLLVSVSGATYVLCAWTGGKWSDRIGHDRMLAAVQMLAAACLSIGWAPSWRLTPFVVIVLYTACNAATWTTFEVVTQHAPSRLNIPQRTGVYNIVWSVCCIGAYILGGALYRWQPIAIFLAPSLLHVIESCWLMRPQWGRVPRVILSADHAHAGESIPQHVKQQFVRMAWSANGIAYFMANALSGLTPTIGARLGLSPSVTIWLFCSMQISRAGGFIIFWYWERWHYHRGWHIMATAVAPLCLAVIFFSQSIWLIMPVMTILGLSYALSYASSLYYSLDLGGQKTALSGQHEAILGMGLFLGPLAGATGNIIFGSTVAAQATVVIVAVALTTMGMMWALRTRRG